MFLGLRPNNEENDYPIRGGLFPYETIEPRERLLISSNIDRSIPIPSSPLLSRWERSDSRAYGNRIITHMQDEETIKGIRSSINNTNLARLSNLVPSPTSIRPGSLLRYGAAGLIGASFITLISAEMAHSTEAPIDLRGDRHPEYIGVREFGGPQSRVRETLERTTQLYGGFYQSPSEPYASLFLENLDPTQPIIISERAESYAQRLQRHNPSIILSREAQSYHAKFFGGIDTNDNNPRALVLSGNLSTSAVTYGLPATREETEMSFIERTSIQLDQLLGQMVGRDNGILGLEGHKYQINIGFDIRDPSLINELNSIYTSISERGYANSTPNFIVGGPNGTSGSEIANLIRDNARRGQDIEVMAPYITDPQITEALIAAHRNGAHVSIITTNPDAISSVIRPPRQTEVQLARLQAAGVNIYAPEADQNLLAHAKAIRIGDMLIAGSHNFSITAGTRQIEISRITYDRAIAEAYGADFDTVMGYVSPLNPIEGDSYERAYIEALVQDGVITANVGTALKSRGSLLVPSNLGATYFYGRALYNNAMRQAGMDDRTITRDDTGIASAMYNLGRVIKGTHTNSEVPFWIRQFDRELQTPGLGALFNEYISIPHGWGRLYKDEVGLIPSIGGAIGAVIDRTYLFHTGENLPGLSTILDPLSAEDNWYKDGVSPEGFFEGTITFGLDFLGVTASAVALYLTVGEPLNLIASEAMRSNIQDMINDAIPNDGTTLTKFNSFFAGISRGAALGLEMDEADPRALKRNLLLSIHDTKGSYYGIENFKVSPYHINSALMRKRAGILLSGIVKPFLMEVVNPFKPGHDTKFRDVIDNLVKEIGSPVELEAVFITGTKDSTMTELIDIRQRVRTRYEEELAKLRTTKIAIGQNKIKESINLLEGKIPKHTKGTPTYNQLIQMVTQAKEKLAYVNKWDSNYSFDKFFNDIMYQGHTYGVDGKEIQEPISDDLIKNIDSVSFLIRNAGEERQLRVAKALQLFLDEVPLNPWRWRMFEPLRVGLGGEGLLKTYPDGYKGYKAVGDVFSFEQAVHMVRNAIMGRGGLAEVMSKYEIYSRGADLVGWKGASVNIVDRIHSFWNTLTKSPHDLVTKLIERHHVIKQLKASTETFKSLEYNLVAQSNQGRKLISFATDITNEGFEIAYNKLWNDDAIRLAVVEKLKKDAIERYNLTDSKEVLNYINDNFDSELRRVVSAQLGPDMDPFTREIALLDDNFFKAAATLGNEGPRPGLKGVEAAYAIAGQSAHFRAQSLGVLSLSSASTFNNRIKRISPGLGTDTTSKITKGKIFTYMFVGMATISFLNSLVNNTSGVSLLSQVLAAHEYHKEDMDTSVDFTPGPLLGFGNTGVRTGTALGMSSLTLGISYWAASASQDIDGISYGFRNSALRSAMDNDLSNLTLMHVSTKKIFNSNELNAIEEVGQFRLTGRFAGTDVDLLFNREAAKNVDNALFRFNILRGSGNTVRKTAIIFMALSTGLTAGRWALSSAITSMRDSTNSLDPLIYAGGSTLMGNLIAKSMGGRGFAGGLLGLGIGLIAGQLIPRFTDWRMFGIGEPGQKLDGLNAQLAADLNNFRDLIRQRANEGNASKLELMAGIYTNQYASLFNMVSGGTGRVTRVIAQQAPLPILQFFMAESIQNEIKSEDGSIVREGQRYINMGIQSAPILGMSLTLGLPFKIVPGKGVMGMAYNDKNNIFESLEGVYTALGTAGLSIAIGEGLTRLFLNVPRLFGGKAIKAPDTLFKGAYSIVNGLDTVTRSTLIGIPTRVAQWMVGSNVQIANELIPKLFNRRNDLDLGTTALRSGPAIASLLLKAGSVGYISSYIGGVLGTAFSNPSMEDREAFIENIQTASFISGTTGYLGYQIGRDMLRSTKAWESISNISTSAGTKLSNKPIIQSLINIRHKPLITKLSASPIIERTIGKTGIIRGRWARPFIAAAIAYSFLTDEDFGYTRGMDTDTITHLSTIGLTAAITGGIAHKIGGFGYSTLDNIERLKKIDDARTKLNNSSKPKIIKRVHNKFLNFYAEGIEADVSSTLKSINNYQQEINSLAKKANAPSSIKSLSNLADRVHTVISKADLANDSQLYRAVIEDIEYDQLRLGIMSSHGAYFTSRNTPSLIRKIGGTAKALVVTAVLFNMAVSMFGERQEVLNNMYRWFDQVGDPNSFQHRLSDIVSNTMRLITRTDGFYADPIGPGNIRVYRDLSSSGTYNPQLVSAMRLNYPSSSMFNDINELFSNAQDMFVLDPSNPFIQTVTPIGFTFRSGEYGTRTGMYVQVQTPGADISTATYAMAAAFSFREALAGNYDALFELQNSMRALRSGDPNADKIMRAASLSILSNTAHLQPLRKRRKYSVVSGETLDAIGADPLLSGALAERQRRSRHLSMQPLASIGSEMILRAATNHRLSDTGLLQQVLNGNTNALRVLLDDPFGIIPRNTSVQLMQQFTGGSGRNSPNTRNTYNMDESDYQSFSSMQLGYYEDHHNINPFLSSISNFFGGVWNTLGGSVPPIVKWTISATIGISMGWLALHSIGSFSRTKETNKLFDTVEEFYDDIWYKEDEIISRHGVKYKLMPVRVKKAQAPGGATIKVMGTKKAYVTKGASYFDINQAFIKAEGNSDNFIYALNKGLAQMQSSINRLNIEYMRQAQGHKVLGFGEGMVSDVRTEHGVKALERTLSKTEDADKALKTLKHFYSRQVRNYMERYVEILGSIEVDIPQHLQHLVEGKTITKVKLVALMGGDSLSIDDIIRINNLTPKQAVNFMSNQSGTSLGRKGGSFIDGFMELVDQRIDDVLTEEVLIKKGRIDFDSLLRSGAILDKTETIRYLTYKVLAELKDGIDSPLYLLRHNFGGIFKTTTSDLPSRMEELLGKVVRTIKGEPHGLSASDDILAVAPNLKHTVSSKGIRNIGGKSLTPDELDAIINGKVLRRVPSSSGPAVSVAYRVNGRRKTVTLYQSTYDQIMDLSKNGDIIPVNPSARLRSETTFRRGLGIAGKGGMLLFEVGTTAIDFIESVDVLSAYSRLGNTYKDGTYTEAQRRNAANEAGLVTTKAAVSMAGLAVITQLGSIGSGIMTAAGVIGGFVGAALGVASLPAWAVVLAVTAIAAGAFALMPKEWKSNIANGIGTAFNWVGDTIGGALHWAGNKANNIIGGAGASALITGFGGMLAGGMLATAILTLSLVSLPVAATLIGAITVGGLIGGAIGLLPGGNSLVNNIGSALSRLPLIGGFMTPTGSWLYSRYRSPSDSPFFVATAADAIQSEYRRHLQASDDYTGKASASLYTSRSMYGAPEGSSPYLVKAGDLGNAIRPLSLTDPTIDRELALRGQLYNQTIIGRYLWREMQRNSSNYRVIREADRNYRNNRPEEQARVNELIEEARRVSMSTPGRRRDSDLGVAIGLASTILEVGQALQKNNQDNTQGLLISISDSSTTPTAPINVVRDTNIDNSNHIPTITSIVGASNTTVTIKNTIDEAYDRSLIANNNPITSAA